MLTEFLRWWFTQLADWLPVRWQATNRAGANAMLVEPPKDDENWLFIQRRGGQEITLGRFAIGSAASRRLRDDFRRQGTTIRLRPPAEMLLERQVVLPLAAERELANVLRYEMEWLTPFPADRLFWSATVEQRDAARGRLSLRLSMIPRAPLTPLLSDLGGAGFAPSALEIATAAGPRVIDLVQPAKPGRGTGLVRGLAAACIVLALIAIALPFAQQTRHGTELQRELAALAPRAAHAEALRRRLLTHAATQNVIAAEAAQTGNPLAVLAAVTAALPDSSYLTALNLNHRQLGIAGEAASAAALLAALSAYPILSDVAFSAPVTRDPAGHKDLFSIQAAVAPE